MAGAVGIVFGLCVLSFTLGAALMYVLVRRREDADSREPAASEARDERMWVRKPAAVEPVDDEYDSRPIHRNPVMGLPQMEPALAALAEPVVKPAPMAEPELAATPELVARPALAAESERSVGLAPVAEFEPVDELTPVAEFEPVTKAEQVTKAAPAMKPEPVVEREWLAEPETVGAARYDRDGDLVPPMGDFEAPESTVAPSTDSPETVAKHAEPTDPATEALAETTVEAPAEETEPEPAPSPAGQTALPPPATPQPVEHTTWVEREDFRQRYLRTFEEVRRKAGSN
ncbi:ribonuclease R [Lentzea albidocapillata subsp. violacea]|uniref:Ribonuclease R n=1 Tax=Lentzea albidocapillata subsp. violacea TaxID=128104 RepID=A0A1G9KFL4_9PSEU|nr:hypothetical protein [Lentzea albidocapillata]SDL48402.1 ribonuclease R [Lentzea albidocapillata subsp. violacea]